MALTIPNTFSANTAISSSEVNANFQAVATLLNSTLLDSTYIQTGGLATANYADSSITYAKLAAAVQALLVPTGAISAWSTETAPTGWLKCDGTAVSRSTYSTLFAVVGETFGQGDNSTTFNLPDFRGRFLRGMDDGAGRDPDAASRDAMATGGNEDDNIGSVQTSSNKAHSHTATDAGHTHLSGPSGNRVGASQATVDGGAAVNVPSNSVAMNSVSTGSGTASITVGSSGDSTESRPANAYVYWIIKY